MATGSSDLHLVVILVLVLLVPSMNRTCGGCTLRCKLLPVRELKKLANTRCQHQLANLGVEGQIDLALANALV